MRNKNQLFMNIKIKAIMKKQILILAIFVLAVLAGTDKSFGQALSPSTFGTAPNPLVNCVGDAQHPKAGNSYTYTFDATAFGAGGPVTGFRFWATKDPNFVSTIPTVNNQSTALTTASGDLLAVSANYNPAANDATGSVDITWSPEILARTDYQLGHIGTPGTTAAPTSTFVVGYATNGCTDNIKVWEIDPSPSFTVDIKNIVKATEVPVAAYGDATTQCVDRTRAAKYNSTSFGVDYNYGKDTLYYEVIASNFVTSWKPTFFITGLDGSIQTANITLASSLANMKAGTTIETGDITSGSYTGSNALTSSAPNTTGGVSLIVRVIISNNNYETLTQESIELAVAGEDAVGFDIDDDAICTVPTTAVDAADDDTATRTIDPRPTLVEGTPTILNNTGVSVP